MKYHQVKHPAGRNVHKLPMSFDFDIWSIAFLKQMSVAKFDQRNNFLN